MVLSREGTNSPRVVQCERRIANSSADSEAPQKQSDRWRQPRAYLVQHPQRIEWDTIDFALVLHLASTLMRL